MSQLVTLFLSFLVLTCLFEARTECIRRRWKACEVSYPEMITFYHGGNTSLSNFPFRTPFRTPRCLGWGGELVKEVDFVFMSCYYFVQAHFVMFSGLLGPLSIKLLYFTAYFFKIWTRFCISCLVSPLCVLRCFSFKLNN